VENFGPGVLARLGFDWARLRQLNPRLILCVLTGRPDLRHAAEPPPLLGQHNGDVAELVRAWRAEVAA